MIRITHNITGLPIPGGHDLLQNSLSTEMKSVFGQIRAWAKENNCNVIVTGDSGWRTDIFEWADRASLNNFLTYANTVTNYDQFYTDYCAVISSIGAAISRTEEEV
jgi:hypothetical protein